MATIDLMNRQKVPESYSESTGTSTSKTTQQSTTGAVLDKDLLNTILSGLAPQMTDEQITAYAEGLLKPQLNAGLEAAQQGLESSRLALEQEQENLAAQLARAILEQQSAYKQSVADVETSALARGMGRSSYTLQTLANQGNALAQVVQQLTNESARQSTQIQKQITQAEKQAAQTTGRLNTDYAATLASKIQELRENQRLQHNQNYMTAVSAAMGSKTNYTSQTDASDYGMNVSGKLDDPDGGSGGSGGKKSSSSGSATGNFTQTV